MNKSKIIFLTIIVVLVIGIPRAWTTKARANDMAIISSDDKEEIITTVTAYFELRYRSHSNLQLEDFRGFVEETPTGDNFLTSESEKLEIELNHAKMYNLRYLDYTYNLEFGEFLVDSEEHYVTVSVIEGHDVEFEISKEISQYEPIISKMRNLQHSIVLRKGEICT